MTAYTDEHPNVVQTIRTGAALTQKGLASLAHLSTLYVIRAEQSQPVTLGLDLATALSNLINLPINDVETRYEADRLAMLTYYRELIKNDPNYESYIETAVGFALDNFRPVGFSDTHPFFLFRTKLCSLYSLPTSAIKFATMFGLHPALLSRLERRQDTLISGSAIDELTTELVGPVRAEMLRIACDRAI